MNEDILRAQALGFETAFLLGDPNYYERFGYRFTHLFGITHRTLPAEYLLVKELCEEALKGITGELLL